LRSPQTYQGFSAPPPLRVKGSVPTMSKGVCELISWESDSQATSPSTRVPRKRQESKRADGGKNGRWAGSSPPCGGPSPPGHVVVNGWRRDERTRDIPQSLPRSLVSSAKPTTGVQVVWPTAPSGASTRSLRMPTELGLPSAHQKDSGSLCQGVKAQEYGEEHESVSGVFFTLNQARASLPRRSPVSSRFAFLDTVSLAWSAVGTPD
jgi:hypothetical protein